VSALDGVKTDELWFKHILNITVGLVCGLEPGDSVLLDLLQYSLDTEVDFRGQRKRER